jgi:hypothetical protein
VHEIIINGKRLLKLISWIAIILLLFGEFDVNLLYFLSNDNANVSSDLFVMSITNENLLFSKSN